MASPAIVWFRHDLRIADQPALTAACQQGGPVIPVYLYAPEEEGNWPPGAASRWWLHHSLSELEQALKDRLGLSLVVRRTRDSLQELAALVEATGAESLFWNRRYEPAVIERDRRIKETMRDRGLKVASFNGSLLAEPWEVQTGKGEPYRVYTPFSKACLPVLENLEPTPRPKKPEAKANKLDSLSIADLELLPKIDWAGGLRDTWQPGSAGAEKRLQHFVSQALADYGEERNRPDHAGSSRLSPHLHFGEISPGQVWRAVFDARKQMRGGNRESAEIYLKELLWREFAHHVLYHFPQTADEPLQDRFQKFAWRDDKQSIKAWQRGQTGYPLVDAGMRELWHTGWMHNRVRMVVASFLTKHLLIPWQKGARWFWDTLVDADLANNSLGWQWTAGCGADAAPYFRIFNPTLQAERFDPQGDYIRQWVPELAQLDPPELLEPKEETSRQNQYPPPLVDHREARARALAAFEQIK